MILSPKEKAEDLVKKLFQFNHRVKWDSDNNQWSHDYYLAKQCALVAVEQILFLDAGDAVDQDYWLEVKQEIKKL